MASPIRSEAASSVDAEMACESVPFIKQDTTRMVNSRHWRGAVGLGVTLAGALGLAGLGSYTGGRAEVSSAQVLAEAGGAGACSAAGEACLDSKCCRDGGKKGLVCYAKNDYFAACSEDCEKGVHPNETHGTYDQYGKFHLDEWGCKPLSNRSLAGCSSFGGADACPIGRCMWKGACMDACDTFASEEACAPNDKCMWKGSCMEACDTFDEAESCMPADKCFFKGNKCMDGCWTFDDATCGDHDRCTYNGTQCLDACWTYTSDTECAPNSRCMWNAGKCTPACTTYPTKDACPSENACIWDTPDDDAYAKCVLDPCSSSGEDCRGSRCCSAARGASGMTCFSKDDNYATCMPECDKKDWACQALGNRTLYQPGCAWAGDSCAKDSLCCNTGFSCIEKDETWTACVQTVKKTTWVSKNIPIPAGWQGTFKGPGRTEYSVPAAAEGEPVANTSLYCFMAILPNSPEVTLMNLAEKNQASIFQCDAHDIFHSWQSAKSGWDTGEATLTNTDVFINVWKQVHDKGMYTKYDWVVKVDADAVLVPGRLKAHIAALHPPAGRAIYLKNNAMDKGLGNNGFLGAIEVFSRKAMDIYFDNSDGCRKTLGIQAGEDGFFKGCMDALGVGYMTDAELFNPDISAGACSMESRAGYHPLKQPVDWQCCLDIINGKPHNVEYGHCDLGYDLNLNFKK